MTLKKAIHGWRDFNISDKAEFLIALKFALFPVGLEHSRANIVKIDQAVYKQVRASQYSYSFFINCAL